MPHLLELQTDNWKWDLGFVFKNTQEKKWDQEIDEIRMTKYWSLLKLGDGYLRVHCALNICTFGSTPSKKNWLKKPKPRLGASPCASLVCAPACPQSHSSIDPTALWVAKFLKGQDYTVFCSLLYPGFWHSHQHRVNTQYIFVKWLNENLAKVTESKLLKTHVEMKQCTIVLHYVKLVCVCSWNPLWSPVRLGRINLNDEAERKFRPRTSLVYKGEE